MNTTPIYIPIRPYLYLFLQDELQHDLKDGPINVSAESVFGQYVMALVQEVGKPTKRRTKYCVRLLVPERNYRRRNGYDARYSFVGLDAADTRVFNSLIEEVFNLRYFARLEVLEALDLGKQRAGSKKAYMEELAAKYSSADGELNYPMLKMRYYRWKAKGKNLIQQAIQGN